MFLQGTARKLKHRGSLLVWQEHSGWFPLKYCQNQVFNFGPDLYLGFIPVSWLVCLVGHFLYQSYIIISFFCQSRSSLSAGFPSPRNSCWCQTSYGRRNVVILICQQIPQVKISSVINQAFAHHSGTNTSPHLSKNPQQQQKKKKKKGRKTAFQLICGKYCILEELQKPDPLFLFSGSVMHEAAGHALERLPTGHAWLPDCREEGGVDAMVTAAVAGLYRSLSRRWPPL